MKWAPVKHIALVHFIIIRGHFIIMCGHFIIKCGYFYNIIWCNFCFHFLEKLFLFFKWSFFLWNTWFLQMMGKGVRSSSGQINSCWGINLNQLSWLPKIHVSSPSGNMISHLESPTMCWNGTCRGFVLAMRVDFPAWVLYYPHSTAWLPVREGS